MPLKLLCDLPAIKRLSDEGCFVPLLDDQTTANRQMLRVAVLNLMPLKEDTEMDLIRVLSSTQLDVELCFMKLRSHVPHHTSQEHMLKFYRYFDEMRIEHFDGLIVTGAPVEQMDFEQVEYWPELTEIFDWARNNVNSTLYICWAAQAGLYYHYGINKYPLDKKKFGVFQHHVNDPKCALFRGFDDVFSMPHSRHTEIRRDDILACKGVRLMAESAESGVGIVMSADNKDVFVTGHMEYNSHTLHNEFVRDKDKRSDVGLPLHYYLDDDANANPIVTWRAHAHLLYNNWLNYYVNIKH